MYSLSNSIDCVKGIGAILEEKLNQKNIFTIKDFLLFLPLRYEDRSKIAKIYQLQLDELVTVQAKVISLSSYYRNRRNITTATIADDTGRVKCMWFNNKFIKNKIKKGEEYFFSGKLNKHKTFTQPIVEDLKADTTHTGRLVPIYSSLFDFKQGTLRRLQKEIVDNLKEIKDPLVESETSLLNLKQTLSQLHFPDTEENITRARERLALEELLSLIERSQKIKKLWKKNKTAAQIKINKDQIPNSIPFQLTNAQLKATDEILKDLTESVPMNRLLIGDVGSGKTVVAGVACHHILKNGYNVALIAPTQILAKQHVETFKKLFPDIMVELITGKNKKLKNKSITNHSSLLTPKLYIGTHAVINRFAQIQPALVIYDEQHRFGVNQRSEAQSLTNHPHILTMSATPIPRSLMLSIFSHLKLSLIDEMPKGRKDTDTWLVPEKKRAAAFDWISQKLTENPDNLALVVCPFIDPSRHGAFENVAAATQTFTEINNSMKKHKLKTKLLHGRLKQQEKDHIIKDLFENKIDVLVTTPIVEVGIDLPTANIMVIEAAERFGMASLHQLRGRVGRAGQESYCLLFSNSKSQSSKKRLETFCKTNNGMKLAELDLQNRGAGDIFGTMQHGLGELTYASWTNLNMISKARSIYDKFKDRQVNWKAFIKKEEVKKEVLSN